MMLIIGKGGFAREVKGYTSQPCLMIESQSIDLLSTKAQPTLIAIGDGEVRKNIFGKYPDLNYICLFRGTEYGENNYGIGTIICPGTILTTNVQLGDHVIVNLNCTIGHDVRIGSFTTLSPGVNVSGNVTIGELCYIGTNAVIKEKITICDKVTIGAGGVVVKDITEPGVYVGNPVKRIK
jgi:sugar O-acyltransferase (sialic acid O-acetyltransferase NeuD family)